MFSVGVCDRFAPGASQEAIRLFNLEYLADEKRIPKKGPAALPDPEKRNDESKYGKGSVVAQAAA
jgi:hypothetical protein